ncbi:MAG TPA: hypothetical protein PKA14_23995 [Leptospiraceae bacterium]|nr:hypothetical protein [Leptospiraceae bacterium]
MRNFIIALCFILSMNCLGDLDPFQTRQKERKAEKESVKSLFWEIISLSSEYNLEKGEAKDNKDGTVTFTYILYDRIMWGDQIKETRTVILRRCLIGQIYRSAENDCKGTGSKDNIWGTSFLKWCPTNDRFCKKNGVADPAISPAAKACDQDTTAGKKWQLPSRDDKIRIFFSSLYNNPIQETYLDTMNYSPSVWMREMFDAQKTYSDYGQPIDKNSSGYNVLCAERKIS